LVSNVTREFRDTFLPQAVSETSFCRELLGGFRDAAFYKALKLPVWTISSGSLIWFGSKSVGFQTKTAIAVLWRGDWPHISLNS